jgi:hypothetical protein
VRAYDSASACERAKAEDQLFYRRTYEASLQGYKDALLKQAETGVENSQGIERWRRDMSSHAAAEKASGLGFCIRSDDTRLKP